MPEITKFEVGKTYRTRSLCDHETVYAFKVVARSDKTITIESSTWGQKRRGVQIRDGWRTAGKVEACKPLGTYSMCPTITADRETV